MYFTIATTTGSYRRGSDGYVYNSPSVMALPRLGPPGLWLGFQPCALGSLGDLGLCVGTAESIPALCVVGMAGWGAA